MKDNILNHNFLVLVFTVLACLAIGPLGLFVLLALAKEEKKNYDTYSVLVSKNIDKMKKCIENGENVDMCVKEIVDDSISWQNTITDKE